jgi:hypothetical protein
VSSHTEYADRIDALKAEVSHLMSVGRHLGYGGTAAQGNAARNLADQLAAIRKDLGHASVEALRVRL